MRGKRVEYTYNHTHIFALMRDAILLFKTLCFSMEFSKGFCNSIQSESSTYITVLCFQKWNFQYICAGGG